MISAMRHKFNPSGIVPSVQIYALFLARYGGGGGGGRGRAGRGAAEGRC
jgi:hypothetical protein